jgi:hypothetical protein
MRAIVEITEKHVEKDIVLHIPRQYWDGKSVDVPRFLKDNDAEYLIYIENVENMPERCAIGYHPTDMDSWNLVITESGVEAH